MTEELRRMSTLEGKIDKLTEHVYASDKRLTESIHKVDTEVRLVRAELQAHDAKAVLALAKAEEAQSTADEAKVPLTWLQRTGTGLRYLTWIGGGTAIIWQLINWMKG